MEGGNNMLVIAQKLHHAPAHGSKTPTGTNTPELNKYRLSVHFPDLRVGKTLVPAGVDRKEVWGTSPLDACKRMAEHFRAAEWVEVQA